MHDFFPEMLDRPDSGRIAASAFYWPFCYILIPFLSTLLVMGPTTDNLITSIVDIACYIINAVVIVSLYFQYMKESLINVQINTRRFFKITLITAGIMVFMALGIMAMSFRSGSLDAMSLFPITETSVLAVPLVTVMSCPALALPVMILANPVTVSCMFYATVFAPISGNHPKLAYLFMALALLLPRLFNMLWLGYPAFELLIYFVQLPFHMMACWTYQKNDTVWAPILTLSIVNLVSCGFILLLQATGMIQLN